MRSTLAALASAGAAFAAITPGSYSEQAPPAYGTSSSSSSVTSSSSSAAGPTGTGGFPECWSTCFKEAGVNSAQDACGNSEATDCIKKSCCEEESSAYEAWLVNGCGSASTTSSNVVGPTGSMSMSHGPSGYAPSSVPSGYSHSSSGGPHSPGSYSHGSSSSKPPGYVASASGYPGPQGNCTTTYTSVCTETETLIYRDSTAYSPTTITHVFTTSLPAASCPGAPYPVTYSSPAGPVSSSSVPAPPYGGQAPPPYGGSGSSSSPASPVGSSAPAPPPYGGSSSSPASPIGSSAPAPPQYGGSGSSSSPASPVGSSAPAPPPYGGVEIVTNYHTVYTTVCPCTETPSSSAAGNGGAPSYYTSVKPVTKPFTYGDWTSYYTDFETVTLTKTGAPGYPTSTSEGQPPYPYPSGDSSNAGGYPTGGYGSGSSWSFTASATIPGGYPGETGSPIAECWAECFAKYNVTSEKALCGDIEVKTCIKAECPFDSYNSYEGWLADYCGLTSTSSAVVGPTGSAYPTGSGSYPSQSAYPTGSGAPQPSGIYGPSGTISSSSTCSMPTPTESCKRCHGQPGTDKYCGLDIHTNIYQEGNAPITCNTVEYDWEITEGMVAPDGVSRMAVLINGQTPGPALKASWGDEIVVHVKNSLPAASLNGTTIHWHGIHQKSSNEFDGVPSLTQCPIAPGETFTYKFRATQFGSSWYHSHFALQAYDGLYGPMIIDGPVQEGISYDDEEFVALQDWRHAPLTEIYHNLELVANNQRSSPTLDNGLINGKNTFNGGGERWSMTVTKGKTYRLRVLNAAIQSTFKFYIDGHSFKVIAADFVPIEPYETNIVNINNGQRYDIIFTADQPSGNYWMRSDVQAPCSNVTNGLDVKAIVHYDDAPEGIPESQAYTYTPECVDEKPENLVPVVSWNAGASSDEIDKDVVIQPNGGNPNLFKWTLSGTAFFSQWSDPTLYSIYENGTVPTYSGDLAIREDNLGEWIYVVIDSPIPLPHPIHLHGHDFLVLDQGVGLYNAATASLNLNNPPRRDTAIMPYQQGQVGGYLVVAFYTNNPGVWLMHCHIGWHNAMGFALQIIEGLEEIKDTVEYVCQMEDNCDSWKAYSDEYGLTVVDSGI